MKRGTERGKGSKENPQHPGVTPDRGAASRNAKTVQRRTARQPPGRPRNGDTTKAGRSLYSCCEVAPTQQGPGTPRHACASPAKSQRLLQGLPGSCPRSKVTEPLQLQRGHSGNRPTSTQGWATLWHDVARREGTSRQGSVTGSCQAPSRTEQTSAVRVRGGRSDCQGDRKGLLRIWGWQRWE